jgi:hypothetical protein
VHELLALGDGATPVQSAEERGAGLDELERAVRRVRENAFWFWPAVNGQKKRQTMPMQIESRLPLKANPSRQGAHISGTMNRLKH